MAEHDHTRQLSKAHAYHLFTLCDAFFTGRSEQHYERTQDISKRMYGLKCTDYGILKEWGLIKRMEKAGYYKPTKDAYLFIRNVITIPRYLTTHADGRFLLHGEQIGIFDILPLRPSASWIRTES